MNNDQYDVWVQPWVVVSGQESSPGGFSLHETREDVTCFVKTYRDSLPPLYPPEQYFSLNQKPHMEPVDTETLEEIRSGKFGSRFDRVSTGSNGQHRWVRKV